MRILGIETALETTEVALFDDLKRPPISSLADNTVYSESVVKLARELLTQNGCKLEEVDAIAVSSGPGSFTGLRIGLSVGKGFSMATNASLIGVSTLDVLAGTVVFDGIVDDQVEFFALVDAKRDEYYIASYRNNGGQVLRLSDPDVVEGSEGGLRLHSPNGLPAVVAGGIKTREALKKHSRKFHTRIEFLDRSGSISPAASLCLLGKEKFLGGEVADVASIEPSYLKDFLIRAKS